MYQHHRHHRTLSIPRLFLNDVALLAHVQAVQELSNILVSHSADLLDIGGGL